MAGLREKQKANRKQRILETASMLFRERGFAHAKIEHIAEIAEVSVGTIYNYYRNKGDLLLAIVALAVDIQLKGGRALVNVPPQGMRPALDALMLVLLDNCTSYVSKEMWRHAMAIATQAPDTPFGTTYLELDESLSETACALMVRLQKDGHIRPDVDARAVGELWFNNLNLMFSNFVRNESMSLDELKSIVEGQSEPLVLALQVS